MAAMHAYVSVPPPDDLAQRCVVLERCGHFPWGERPEAFRAAVDGFVAG